MDTLIQEIEKKAGETSFSGVVAMYRGGKPLYRDAFGYADITCKKKNNLDTKLAIASGTKIFTAMGIGVLIDDGKLSLDTTIRDIFRQDVSYIDPRATIAQLLTHTSGIYDYYDEELDIDPENFHIDIPWDRLETPSDYLPLFENRKPKYSPGERFSYSNGGYIFAGIIIEHITGKLYRDFINERVFKPASMGDSGYFAFNRLPENTAYGYKTSQDGGLETNVNNLPMRGASDGGAYTTTDDLHKFWRALFSNKILSQKLTGTFLTPHVKIKGDIEYGYGVYITKFKETYVFYVQGGDAGVGFDSRYIPEKELQVTIISNQTDGGGEIGEVIFSGLEKML